MGLTLKPLRLILEILVCLNELDPQHDAYMTARELYQIVVPLAGVQNTPSKLMAEAILLRRSGDLSLEGWPNCAPNDNDKRMTREFLLFLALYGHLLRQHEEGDRDDERFYLHRSQVQATADMLGIRATELSDKAIQDIISAPQISTVERQRTLVSVVHRKEQQGFRSRVLKAAEFRCHICGVEVSEVLEAAHIVPVMNGGTDRTDNGLCLRSDIHALFDAGHLRVRPDGAIILTGSAALPENYGNDALPKHFEIPAHVDLNNVAYRWKYL